MMLIAIIAIAASPASEPIRFFRDEFETYVTREDPYNVEWAMSQARLRPEIGPYVGRIEGMFSPTRDVPAHITFARLALFDGGRWLIVDRCGFARLDGRPGRFDIVAFEQLVRREKPLRNLGRSPLATLRIENWTKQTVTVVDSSGKVKSRTPPAGRAQFITFFCGHKVFAGKEYAGRITSELYKYKSALPGYDVEVKMLRGPWLPGTKPNRLKEKKEATDNVVLVQIR